ncbi:serine hydrolase domain-containing protein [Hamadaea sp. NPDC051192]|uniref:serine hydrolase domain-containing protein n=1 Tax=Hamadaea sp. NPDC051192 TaxID=3154940 RepID=UPI00341FB8E3
MHAVDLMRARGGAAQLVVWLGDRLLLDEAVGGTPDDLFWTFSAGKPFTALAVHGLAERGDLVLTEPVARYWPEFAANGKDGITIQHVLQHRSGLYAARGVLLDGLGMADWDRSVRAIERARPKWPAGDGPAYQVVSYGFILGELIRRVTGEPVGDYLDRWLFQPLGMRDTYLGLPDEAWPRRVPIRSRGALGRASAAFFNRRTVRQAVVPAAGVSTTARDLARFYRMMLNDGELDGVRVVRPATIAAAVTPSSDGEVDRVVKLPMRWANGFQLGGTEAGRADGLARPMGRLSPAAFGHNGSNCCIGWADPDRSVVFAYTSDLLVPGHDGARHMAAVADAVLDV